MEPRMTLKAARELAGSHLITSCAALAALFLFIPTGQRIIASALDGSAEVRHRPAPPPWLSC